MKASRQGPAGRTQIAENIRDFYQTCDIWVVPQDLDAQAACRHVDGVLRQFIMENPEEWGRVNTAPKRQHGLENEYAVGGLPAGSGNRE